MWDDFRILAVTLRHGSRNEAARELRLDEATISRRLTILEERLGFALFERVGRRLAPTIAALAMKEGLEEAEQALISARVRGEMAGAGEEQRPLRLTAISSLVHRVLIPALPELKAQHPTLTLELTGRDDNLSLARREADVALRLARPQSGDLLARRIGTLRYQEAARPAAPDTIITLYQNLSRLPEAAYLENKAITAGIALRVDSMEAMMAAVLAGLGRGLLPNWMITSGLTTGEIVLEREIWLLVRPDIAKRATVKAVIDWLDQTLAKAGCGVRA